MRIAHLNFARSWRGGEQQTLYLARFLQQQNVQQIVIVYPGSELEKRCQQEELPVFSIAARHELSLFSAIRIARLIIRDKIQLVHAHSAQAHAIALLVKRLCRLRGHEVRLVVSRRVDFHANKNFLSRRKYLTPLVDAYIAISNKVKQILLADGIPENKISIAYSGIDIARFSAPLSATRKKDLRREFKVTKHITIGNVAALSDHKDQATLLKAAALLLEQKLPPWKLFIIGDGELRGELETLAGKLKLQQQVIFTGFRQDIPDLLRFLDIFVMSSKEEGLGTSLLDAMAAGLPIVATRGGGIPEIVVHHKGGLLSPVQEPTALAGNLARLIKEPTLRRKMGAFNKKHVENFHYEKTGATTLQVYRRLLQS